MTDCNLCVNVSLTSKIRKMMKSRYNLDVGSLCNFYNRPVTDENDILKPCSECERDKYIHFNSTESGPILNIEGNKYSIYPRDNRAICPKCQNMMGQLTDGLVFNCHECHSSFVISDFGTGGVMVVTEVNNNPNEKIAMERI